MNILLSKINCIKASLVMPVAVIMLSACHINEYTQSHNSDVVSDMPTQLAEAKFNIPLLLINSNDDGVYQSVNGKLLIEDNTGSSLEFSVSGMGDYLQIPDTGAQQYRFSFFSDSIDEQRQYLLSAAQLREYSQPEGVKVWTVDFAEKNI